jgi:hypothetical protein
LHLKNLSYNSTENYQQSQTLWLPTGSNKIQPLGVYNGQYRIKLTDMFEKSHESKIRAAQQSQRQGDDDHVMNYRQGGSNAGGNIYSGNKQSYDDEDSDDDERD